MRVPLFIYDESPCSQLPAPRFILHSDRPIPLGLPVASLSVLNSQSAICCCCCSDHVPIKSILQASEAPKCSTVCSGCEVLTSKLTGLKVSLGITQRLALGCANEVDTDKAKRTIEEIIVFEWLIVIVLCIFVHI